MPNTIRLYRVFRAPPERIYRAFLEPEALAKWNPPHGFVARIHEMDVRVGGRYRMSFINFGTGKSHDFGGTYVELVPNERMRWTDSFDDPNLPGTMQMTVNLTPVAFGTEVEIIQDGLPDAIPACHLGWQESLGLLARLVEADIPDGGPG
jgi:uncharacterized protein YndB with AHSA1/START domain